MSNDNDLFDNPMVRAARASMDPKEQERYRVLGEQMFGSVDFVTATSLDNQVPPFDEAAAYISVQLRSGLHPSLLENSEKEVMRSVYGDTWYKNWGYVERDLNEIFTTNFSNV